MNPRKLQLAALLGILAMLGSVSCAVAFSKEARKRANMSLKFSQVLSNPKAYVGQVIMVGGRIIETTPKGEGTELIVMEQSLSFIDHSPITSDTTQGRFILMTKGFLDPAVYKAGRRITTIAEIIGAEERKVGEVNYLYPMLNSVELKLWPNQSYYGYPYRDPFFWGPWGPTWGPGPYMIPGPIPHHDFHH